MFGALKRGRFRSMASLILVVNVVGELQQKRTLAASRGFLVAARLSCFIDYARSIGNRNDTDCSGVRLNNIILTKQARYLLAYSHCMRHSAICFSS